MGFFEFIEEEDAADPAPHRAAKRAAVTGIGTKEQFDGIGARVVGKIEPAHLAGAEQILPTAEHEFRFAGAGRSHE